MRRITHPRFRINAQYKKKKRKYFTVFKALITICLSKVTVTDPYFINEDEKPSHPFYSYHIAASHTNNYQLVKCSTAENSMFISLGDIMLLDRFGKLNQTKRDLHLLIPRRCTLQPLYRDALHQWKKNQGWNHTKPAWLQKYRSRTRKYLGKHHYSFAS